jgi:hypothetical protein
MAYFTCAGAPWITAQHGAIAHMRHTRLHA